MKNGRMNDMYKQLEEAINKFNSLSQIIIEEKKAHKKEIKKLTEEFKKERNEMNSKIQILEKLSEEKDKLIEKILNEIDRLKKIVNNNSDNSSNQPSTDIKGNEREVSNNREKTNKKLVSKKIIKNRHYQSILLGFNRNPYRCHKYNTKLNFVLRIR